MLGFRKSKSKSSKSATVHPTDGKEHDGTSPVIGATSLTIATGTAAPLGDDDASLKLAVLNCLVKSHEASGDASKALEYHLQRLALVEEKMVECSKTDLARILYEGAELYVSLGQVDQAKKSLDWALQLEPKALYLKKGMANLYIWMDQVDKAFEMYKLLIRSTRDTPQEQYKLYYTCGRLAHVQYGNLELALHYYLQELDVIQRWLGKFHLENSRVYHEISRLYEDLCDYSRALYYLQQALNVEEAHLDRAKTKKDRQKIENLLAGTKRCMGVIYYKTGNFKEALGTVGQVMSLGGSDYTLEQKLQQKQQPKDELKKTNLASTTPRGAARPNMTASSWGLRLE